MQTKQQKVPLTEINLQTNSGNGMKISLFEPEINDGEIVLPFRVDGSTENAAIFENIPLNANNLRELLAKLGT